MKINRLIMAFCAIFPLSISFAQDAYHCSRIKGHQHNFDRSARLSNAYIDLTEEYDVHYYALDINLERTSTDISGTVQIHAAANVAILDTFLFELWDDFTIEEILLDGVTPMTFTHDESAVIVPVDFTEGDEFFMQITYNGTPPVGGGPLGGGGMTNASSPSWGNQVTWSLSEPFAAYEWFPCKQSLTDKADSVQVFVTTDSTNMAGSNGILTGVSDLPEGKKRYEWKSNYPIDYYLISVSVAEYVEYTVYAEPAGVDPVMIQNFIYNNPLCLPFFEEDINETSDYLELYSELFGIYPFHEEKYGHCMAPIGGGMEHQTMTTQGYFVNTLTAHELAHQWFGDYVTCGSWSDIWINEGFASYAEELMLEEFYPGDEVASMLERHNDIMSASGGSVWVEDSLNVSRIFNGRLTYNKGAAILHTLRFLIGDDEVFFEALRSFQSTYANSTARAADFKTITEVTSGLDFTEFFEEWYYGEGYPTYSIEYAKTDDEVVLILSQEASASGVTPFFTNDLEITVSGVDGATETFRLFGIDGVSSTHIIPFTEEVASIDCDPNNWIINGYDGAVENLELLSLAHENIDLEIYPNPATNYIQINTNGEVGAFTIYTVDGKPAKYGNLKMGDNKINIQDLAKGVYYLAFKGGKQTFTIQ